MKSRAFTIAEILITLAIIGVVAAITIPVLLKNIQDIQFKTSYRKAYSAISQALLKAQNNGTLASFSGTNGGIGMQANFLAVQAEFKVSKICDSSHLSDCWDTSTNSESFHNEQSTALSFIDNSGMTWRARTIDADWASPVILVDTNGSKKPNKYGQDRFPFFFSNTSYGVYTISGLPTKIIPGVDRFDNSSLECPSYATHPCYYTSWLIGAN